VENVAFALIVFIGVVLFLQVMCDIPVIYGIIQLVGMAFRLVSQIMSWWHWRGYTADQKEAMIEAYGYLLWHELNAHSVDIVKSLYFGEGSKKGKE